MKRRAEAKVTSMLGELETMASELNLPEEVKAEAVAIYESAYNKHYKGRYLKALLMASICVACKEKKFPITPIKILSIVTNKQGISERTIVRACWKINKTLKFKTPPLRAEDYIDKFCADLGLSDKVKETAKATIADIEKKGLAVGRRPSAVAAGVIYIVAASQNEYRTQHTIENATGITANTIRNIIWQINEHPKCKEED